MLEPENLCYKGAEQRRNFNISTSETISPISFIYPNKHKSKFKIMLTFATFITTAMDAFRMLSTLLIMPSVSKKGSTISIVCAAYDISVSETSHSLMVNEVTARHNFSPEFRTVSFISSNARNATVHNFFKCFPTYTSRIYPKYISMSDYKLNSTRQF